MQLYYCSHILLLLHQPILGGPDAYAQQRRSLRECINAVCGIAMTLTDFASSVMCSQCLFIGRSPLVLNRKRSCRLNYYLVKNTAGGPLEDSGQRATVLNLLASCRQRAGWPVDDLGEKLKSRWWEGSA